MRGEQLKVIWLEPMCSGQANDYGRMWCEDDVGPCECCGTPWTKYILADGAAQSTRGERSMRDSHLYRKKPVVIQAWQWFCKGHAPSGVGITEHPDCAWIDTLEGTMKVSSGDWIIKGVKGEFYPCKPDIFSATYESVGAETAQEPLNQTSPAVNETGDK